MNSQTTIRHKRNELFVENVPVRRIVDQVGTPVYIYSKRELLSRLHAFHKAFSWVSHTVCFALKANANLSILRLLSEQGSGADVVSGGELYLALKARVPADRIVFDGTGKTREEITAAVRKRILIINAESAEELRLTSDIGRTLKRTVRVGIRVNPDIDVKTHPYIATGLRTHKFGVNWKDAHRIFLEAHGLPNLEVRGIHMHLGSQIRSVRPYVNALRRLLELMDDLTLHGIHIDYLDIGGGFGIRYGKGGGEVDPRILSKEVKPLLRGRSVHLILEPGRAICARAGLLATRVLYRKRNGRRKFVVVDAGMNDFIRPSLYDAYHPIVSVCLNKHSAEFVDVVGPVCETGDFFARRRKLQRMFPGELLAILDAGAYGFSMSSNYNIRPRPAEVLVDGSDFEIIRRRESYRDLVRLEPPAPQ